MERDQLDALGRAAIPVMDATPPGYVASVTVDAWATDRVKVDVVVREPADPEAIITINVVDQLDDDVEDFGPVLVITPGDSVFMGSCQRCGRHLRTIRPNESLDEIGAAWDRHVHVELCSPAQRG
jgi:hypothetical protein